jgi:hypothetical protein
MERVRSEQTAISWEEINKESIAAGGKMPANISSRVTMEQAIALALASQLDLLTAVVLLSDVVEADTMGEAISRLNNDWNTVKLAETLHRAFDLKATGAKVALEALSE